MSESSHSVTRRWSEVLKTSAPLHEAQQSLLQAQYGGEEHVNHPIPPPSDVSITIPMPAPSTSTTVVVDRRQAATILQAHEEPDRAYQKQQQQHDQYEYKQLSDKSDHLDKPPSSQAFQACTPTNTQTGNTKSSRSSGNNRSRANSSNNKEYAVDIKNMTLSFGKGKTILHKVNLQIEVGKIYGLLGPSGCGKTTLIRCILSQLEPKKGSVLCFGKKPGSIDSGVPGKDVGYMPQEIALYDEFTIEQNLSFYAKLHGMPSKEFKERAKYLCDMLDLKDTTSKSVHQLSGGQQRRTSLAIGLLHSPKLLILDEPTVGVDPTLRKKIWHYLKRISKKEHTAVLLTTHYIEEARQAHSVGFMRDGRMLKQGSPNAIIEETGSDNLEDAFLKICKRDEKKRGKDKKDKKDKDDDEDDDNSDDDSDDEESDSKRKSESKDDKDEQSESSSSSSSSEDDDEDDERANEEEIGISASPPSLLTHASKQSPNEFADKDDKEHSSEPSSSKNLPISITVHQIVPQAPSDQPQVLTTNFNVTAVEPASFNSLQQQDFKSPTAKGPSSNHRSRKHHESGKKGSEAAAKRHLQSPEPEADDEEHGQMLKKGSQKGSTRDAKPSEEELTGWTLCLRRVAFPRSAQLFGLCWKNIQRMLRGIAALVFQFLLPSLQVILFCVAIGKDPIHVHMGLVNLDVGTSTAPMLYPPAGVVPHLNPNQLSLPYDPEPEDMGFLARDLYGFLNDRFIVHNYPTPEAAIDAVQKNEVWGMVHIPYDFTNTMLKRINETIYNPSKIDNSTLINSTITYTLDMSNEQMSVFLVKSIAGAYADLIQKYEPIILETSPLQQGEAVYGSNDASFTDFVAPGIIITIAFSGSIGLTAITFVLDKKTGNMDRIWASGVWASEIMLAQVITQLLIFIVQIGLLFIFGLVVFKLPLHGSVFLLFFICVLLGVTGMMFGLVIASKVSEERDAMQCALGSFFPALLLSGVMWPIEAIPIPLYWLALSLPTTWAAEAGRSIMSRGWGIEHRQVWLGIVVPFAWSFVFFLWAAKSLRAKK